VSNVIRLPDRMERQWHVFEGRLREKLSGEGCPADVADAALQNLRIVYLEYARNDRILIHSGDHRDGGLTAINEWVGGLCMGLLGAVLMREIELILLRGPRPPSAA
jgi:hypothetical protein